MNFRNLNKATPKDEYHMPIADMFINNASGHWVIGFLDGNSRYNQIFMTEEDISKITFRCPGFICLFEWVVKTFGDEDIPSIDNNIIKNKDATNIVGPVTRK
jgi:hypothetical protein